MPLKCLKNDTAVYAYELSEAGWIQLKEQNSREKLLRMPCCDAKVVLKTSALGTKFFAHARRGPCTSAPETAEHLLAKVTILQALRQCDWHVVPEVPGLTSDGQAWIADVLATKGSVSVAFEIQWSPQEEQETIRRQLQYASSNVRSLWLFRQRNFPVSKETPAFHLFFNSELRDFQVWLPSDGYKFEDWRRRRKSQADTENLWAQKVPLDLFVRGTLCGALKFAPSLNASIPVTVYGGDMECWRCRRMTHPIRAFSLDIGKVFEQHCDAWIEFTDLEHNSEFADLFCAKILPSGVELKKLGIGAIKKRFSKTIGSTYLSNGCVHCGALIGNFFSYQIENTRQFFKSEVLLTFDLANTFGLHNTVMLWWFDCERAICVSRIEDDRR